jgi:rare lipoprotein A
MKFVSRALLLASLFWGSSVSHLSAALASWYGEAHRGRLMANGRPFDPDQLTAASWAYPLGTRVRVSHLDRAVEVTITDRGPAPRLVREGRVIDLSRAAFAELADSDVGLIEVTVSEVPAKAP